MTSTPPTIDTRFAYIEALVDMVISGASKSLIVCGDGGLGKTFTVTGRLKRAGLRARTDVGRQVVETAQVSTPRVTINGPKQKIKGGWMYTYETESASQGQHSTPRGITGTYDYDVVKGYSTPGALYQVLYDNTDRLVIFDDCDSVWKDPVSVSILKAALDSYDERWVSWLSKSRGDLPATFEFKGRIIFISNLSLAQLDQAVLSRALYVDVSMSPNEKIERIRGLVPKIRPTVALSVKHEALSLLAECASNAGDLNLRTFLKVVDIRLAGRADWRELARYVVTAIDKE